MDKGLRTYLELTESVLRYQGKPCVNTVTIFIIIRTKHIMLGQTESEYCELTYSSK